MVVTHDSTSEVIEPFSEGIGLETLPKVPLPGLKALPGRPVIVGVEDRTEEAGEEGRKIPEGLFEFLLLEGEGGGPVPVNRRWVRVRVKIASIQIYQYHYR